MTDAMMPNGGPIDREKTDESPKESPENPFVDEDLDMSDFGENPDTETAG